MIAQTTLPTFQSQLVRIAAAERRDGWLGDCADTGRFLLPSRSLVASLAELLRSLGGRVLEVCSGGGELAGALSAHGVSIMPTDADPPIGSGVLQSPAQEALDRYRPSVVLGCFVPIDAGVDEAVLACPTVRSYVVLGGRINGQLGPAALWHNRNWTAEPLHQISQWMLTRHDVLLETPRRNVLQHGEAWRLDRL